LTDGSEIVTANGRRLKLLGFLKVGGMGEIYAAFDPVTNDEFAIKVPIPQTDSANREWFEERELQFPQSLRHPHVVGTLDRGTTNGLPFLVMEYLEGSDVESWVRLQTASGSFVPWREACAMIAQAAAGLAAAHDRGIIHRDVKPANLFRTTDGTVKVLDWGLIRFVGGLPSNDAETDAHVPLGTLDYMAPEQAADPRTVTPRSDLYSLGCTFYFLLTGEAPFANCETAAKKLQSHQSVTRPSVRTVRRDVPRRIDKVLQRLMAPDPGDRYRSAEVFLHALNRETAQGVRGMTGRASNRALCYAGVKLKKGVRELRTFAIIMAVTVVGYYTWQFFLPEIPAEPVVVGSGGTISVPGGIRDRFPDLVRLILETPTLADDERQRWVNRVDRMSAEERNNLHGSLTVLEQAAIRGGVYMPPEMRERYPKLVALILSTESMTVDQRNHWFSLLYLMTDERRNELQELLERERDELRLLDQKYAAAVETMGQKDLSAFVAMAESPNVEDRKIAAVGLMKSGAGEKIVVPVLVQLVEDADDKVRFLAALAIMKVCPEYLDPDKRKAIRKPKTSDR
jgi:serine/threonine-protein kinase